MHEESNVKCAKAVTSVFSGNRLDYHDPYGNKDNCCGFRATYVKYAVGRFGRIYVHRPA